MIYYQNTIEDSDPIPMAEPSCACHDSLQGLKINVNTVEEIPEHSNHLFKYFIGYHVLQWQWGFRDTRYY